MTDAEKRAYNAGLERAAEIARPPFMHRKGKPGLWRVRRAQIADDIIACKLDCDVK